MVQSKRYSARKEENTGYNKQIKKRGEKFVAVDIILLSL